MPEQAVTLQTFRRGDTDVDTVVAARPVAAGETVLRVPDRLIVTLDRVFQDTQLAELLTTSQLSELACLALYLAYERRQGPDSPWHPFLRELDRIQGRGALGARSPLLWEPWEVDTYLKGSPVIGMIKERAAGILREYGELDTVWYMAGSLFGQSPYAPPTEQFSADAFLKGFAAVQASVVHLQSVPLTRRFALVPLGPPLLTYSSMARGAMLRFDPGAREVVLAVDRDYAAGEPVLAWCGPQPNSRLLLNYGLVDEHNPYDRLPLKAVISGLDPLYGVKRQILARSGRGLSTQHVFQLGQGYEPLPPELLPFVLLARARTSCEALAVDFGAQGGVPPSPPQALSEEEATAATGEALAALHIRLRDRLAQYGTTMTEDAETLADPTTPARKAVATRLVAIEKATLSAALAQLECSPGWRGEAVLAEGGLPHLTLD